VCFFSEEANDNVKFTSSLEGLLFKLSNDSTEFTGTIFPTRFECSFESSPLVSSVVLNLPHSFRVFLLELPECFDGILHTILLIWKYSKVSSPLVSSVVSNLPHSLRVNFLIFLTRLECIFESFPAGFECNFEIFSTRFECKFSFTIRPLALQYS
jgi:hypothetical protein